MKTSHKLLMITALITLVASPFAVSASKTPNGKVLELPEAANHSDVISLGTTFDRASGHVVEGYAIVHYKKGYHHRPDHAAGPGGKGNSGGGEDTTSSCYAFLSKGAMWRSAEPYMVDTSSASQINGADMANLMDTAVEAWNNQVDAVIFGGQIDYSGDGADTQGTDNKNEVEFGSISSPGAIAVTTVWGIFSGPPHQRKLVEWDMVFDDDDFNWSAGAGSVAGHMDFLNIAVHEVGHAAGLGHPSDSCTEETMYRFASEGETQKRDLNAGDIAGIQELY